VWTTTSIAAISPGGLVNRRLDRPGRTHWPASCRMRNLTYERRVRGDRAAIENGAWRGGDIGSGPGGCVRCTPNLQKVVRDTFQHHLVVYVRSKKCKKKHLIQSFD